MSDLASMLCILGKRSDAEALLREALEGRLATVGPKHRDTLTLTGELGLLLMDLGRLGEAEPLLRSTLQARRASLGARHPDTLSSIQLEQFGVAASRAGQAERCCAAAL